MITPNYWLLSTFVLCATVVNQCGAQNPTVACGKNEVFMWCGTACPKTCENPYPQICTANCVQGCFCEPGLLRRADGVCVPQEDCGGNCGKNEIFRTCGTACPPTCENPNPQICTAQCVIGCFCEPGLLRRADGACVKQEDCSAGKCGKNEIFRACGTACPPTCENPNPRFCTEQCVVGCFCEPGLLRRADGACVSQEHCNGGSCGKNEVLSTCGTACPPTCENPNPHICTMQCVIGCFCEPGLLRRADGACVNQEDCTDTGCPNPRVLPCSRRMECVGDHNCPKDAKCCEHACGSKVCWSKQMLGK